jgi:TolB-like protein
MPAPQTQPPRRFASAGAVLLLCGCASGPSLRVALRPGEAAPRVLWTQESGQPSQARLIGHQQLPGGNGPPAVTADGTVLVASKDALVAFAPGGQKSWEFRDGTDFQSGAVDADGRVLARWMGGIAMLDARGKKLWSKNVTAVDALLDGHGGTYLLEEKSLSAIDVGGRELWRVAAHGKLWLLPEGPAVAWGELRNPNSFTHVPWIHLQRLDSRGRSLGVVDIEGVNDPLVVAADRILGVERSDRGYARALSAFDPAGKQVGPQIKLRLGDPVLIDDQNALYASDINGVTVFGPDGARGWTFNPGWPSGRYQYTPTPVSYALGPDQMLYIGAVSQLENGKAGTGSFLFAVRGDGSERWAMMVDVDGTEVSGSSEANLSLAPEVAVGADGVLFVSLAGKLTAIDPGSRGKSAVAWSPELRAGRSPLALGFSGSTTTLAAAAGPAIVVDSTGVTASSGSRFDVKKGTKVAVLNFVLQTKEVQQSDAGFLSDVVRGALLSALPGVDVIDRDNLLILLQASGKSLADCEGECEVETGRRIGADLVVSGELLRFGRQLKLSLRLHETASGKLLSSAVAAGDTVDQLEQRARGATASLAGAVRVGP